MMDRTGPPPLTPSHASFTPLLTHPLTHPLNAHTGPATYKMTIADINKLNRFRQPDFAGDTHYQHTLELTLSHTLNLQTVELIHSRTFSHNSHRT